VKEGDMQIIAKDLRFPEGPVARPDGSVILVEIAAGRLTQVLPDGKKRIVAKTGGGPNGAAIGPDGRCYVCNNGGMPFVDKKGLTFPGLAEDDAPTGWIEAIDLGSGDIEVLYTNCDDRPLCGPNDIVFDSFGGFWFTDHGKVRRTSRDRGGVYYAKADGSSADLTLSASEAALLSNAFSKLAWSIARRGRGQ